MRILEWEEFGRSGASIGPFAAAIGVFDGLHLGHQALIGRVLSKAPLASVVVTFAENPKRFLHGQAFPGDILTLRQRTGILASMGVDVTVLIDFSGDFGKLPGKEFLSVLSAGGALRYLAVGHDFRCGYRLDTGADEIRSFCEERGVDVEFLRAVRATGHPVSSSRIRRAIVEGRLEEAAALMGRPFEIDLDGGEGRGTPRQGGQSLPPAGRYEAIALRGDGAEARTEATLREGGWELLPPVEGRLRALRLLKSVSRE